MVCLDLAREVVRLLDGCRYVTSCVFHVVQSACRNSLGFVQKSRVFRCHHRNRVPRRIPDLPRRVQAL